MNILKKYLIVVLFLGSFTVVKAQSTILQLGADQLEKHQQVWQGKKIGVVTNPSGMLSNGTHIVDFLMAQKANVTTIFAPEHGFRGKEDAGEKVQSGIDATTGIPVLSLYGDKKKPNAQSLKEVEVLLYDIQDVGVRFFTYISTLHYVMESCAENNIPLVVLDRPNPNGALIDGPILEKEYTSFVGVHPIPILHGLTVGELAKMINGEKWLKNGVQCQLTVIPCANYQKKDFYHLPVRPSPNLPNDQSINLYASLCLFEGTNVSMGRGTDWPFQVFGSPYLAIEEFSFTPLPNFGAKNPLYNGKLCKGKDLRTHPQLDQLELNWLLEAYQKTADPTTFFNPFFTKLAGTKSLQKQIEAGWSEKKIRATWAKGLKKYKKQREPYLLYN